MAHGTQPLSQRLRSPGRVHWEPVLQFWDRWGGCPSLVAYTSRSNGSSASVPSSSARKCTARRARSIGITAVHTSMPRLRYSCGDRLISVSQPPICPFKTSGNPQAAEDVQPCARTSLRPDPDPDTSRSPRHWRRRHRHPPPHGSSSASSFHCRGIAARFTNGKVCSLHRHRACRRRRWHRALQ